MSNQPQAKYLKDYQAPSHSVEELHLTFELQPTTTQVTSIARYHAQSGAKTLTLDGVELSLEGVWVDGTAVSDYQVSEDTLTLNNLPSQFELKIVTKISPETNTSLEGLYLSDGAYCTQCEAEGFRKITYFLDRPDVLTKYTVKIIGEQSMPFLLSNGNKVESGELEDGRHFTVWEDPHKKPSYLFALVAGDFDVLRDTFTTKSGREVALELFVDKGNLSKAPHAMSSLKKSMEWDETRFDLEYDLDIYMIVAVDFFNMGAMENKGLNVFNSACVLANQETATDRDFHTIESIVGHEYFHNWTGNRVTCRDWFQLSLKEGLTVFRDQEFSSDLGSRGLNRIDAVMAMRSHQFAEDAGPMAHPIRPQKVIEMNNFYTVTVYNKGAEVIRMMHTLLGEVGFQKGMKLYFERHDGQAVTCDDFVAAMQDASGVDLTQFKLWYEQFGTPTVSIESQYSAETQQYTLEISQKHAENDPITAPLHIPVALELIMSDGSKVELKDKKVLNLTDANQTFVFEGIKSEPTPVLMEDFSAPCKMNFAYTQAQLLHILKHASSEYAKWEAVQQIFQMEVCNAVKVFNDQGSISLSSALIDAFKGLLNSNNIDKALLSELLLLPSFDSLAAQFTEIPVDALISVTNQFEQEIAQQLSEVLLSVYNSTEDDGSLSHQAVSARSLKNTCLYYLAKANKAEASELISQQVQSSNMTVVLGGLKAAVQGKLDIASSIMEHFDTKWRHDPLVMDKWFALQAQQPSSDVVSVIKQLFDHPSFDKANPNRVRALVGSFARLNPAGFHNESGQGYELLGDLLIELNAINPQNASRMVTPLMSFKRFDSNRKSLMQAQLTRLINLDGLSNDLYEKLDKALN